MVDPLPWWQRPRTRFYAVVAAMWLIILVVLALAARVLLPFLLAFLIAYVIDPIISRLARQGVGGKVPPRAAAVLFVYIVLGILMWVAAVTLVPQIYGEMIRGLGQLREVLAGLGPEDVHDWSERIQRYVDRYGLPVELVPGGLGARPHVSVDLAEVVANAIADVAGWARTQLGNLVGLSGAFVGGVVRSIFFVVLLLMLTAFISMDAPRILAWVANLVPGAVRSDWLRLVDSVDHGLAGVVRGQLTVCLLNGVLTFIGLVVLGIPFPFALAALATVFYLVPIFGTIISTAPVVLLALTSGGVSKAVLALGLILAIHGLEAYILNPKIVGDASKIHPVLIVLALVIGEHWFGLVGALLAFPTAGVVAAVFKFLQVKAAEIEARLEPPILPPGAPPPA